MNTSFGVRRLRRRAADHGFTLIELLVVVVIIGILIAIAIPLYLRTKQVAYVAVTKADLHTMQLEEQNYYSANSRFGSTEDLLAANPKLVLSDGSIGAVVWSSADGFCVGAANSKGPGDNAAPFAAFGYPYKSLFFQSTTGTTSGTLCSTPSGATPLGVHFIDQTGGH